MPKGIYERKIPMSQETKDKISVALTGRVVSEETRDIIRKFRTGKPSPSKGKHWTLESRLRSSIIQKEVQNRPDVKVKQSIAQIEAQNRPDVKARASMIQTTKWQDPEYRKKQSLAICKGMNHSEVKVKHCKVSKELWQDPEYVAKIAIALKISPNKPEIILLNLLQELYPNNYRYSGDYSFMINGKNPDFVNINGQKKCIELFGDYWHKGQDPQDRKDIFAKDGWDTLIIWENELKSIGRVKFRIHKFQNKTPVISPEIGPGLNAPEKPQAQD